MHGAQWHKRDRGFPRGRFRWTEDYYAAVTTADALIGSVMDAVKRAGLESDTAILVTADHGGQAKSQCGNSMDTGGPGVEKADRKSVV